MARNISSPSNLSSTSGPIPDSTGFEGGALAEWDLRSMFCFETARSGSHRLRDDKVACFVAIRIVDSSGVDEGGAEATARSRSAMKRSTRGARVVG